MTHPCVADENEDGTKSAAHSLIAELAEISETIALNMRKQKKKKSKVNLPAFQTTNPFSFEELLTGCLLRQKFKTCFKE